jgi:hypothetical protein
LRPRIRNLGDEIRIRQPRDRRTGSDLRAGPHEHCLDQAVFGSGNDLEAPRGEGSRGGDRADQHPAMHDIGDDRRALDAVGRCVPGFERETAPDPRREERDGERRNRNPRREPASR